jgi:hypothetical protein
MNFNARNRKPESWDGQRFRGEKSIVVVIWLLIFILLWTYLLIIALRTSDRLMFFCVSATSVFIYLLVIVTVQGQSDIIIGGDGISRCTFGVVWQRVRWDDMMVIKVFDSYNPTKTNNRGFNILFIRGHLFSPFGRKIAFDDKIDRWPEFLKVLNLYIEQYHIKVESTVGGVASAPTRL